LSGWASRIQLVERLVGVEAQMFSNLLTSILHNVGVVIVGLGIAYLGASRLAPQGLYIRSRYRAGDVPSIPTRTRGNYRSFFPTTQPMGAG
jgi:hypothetical protein